MRIMIALQDETARFGRRRPDMPNNVGKVHMPNKVGEVPPRTFNPMSTPGLSNKAREAVNAAFEAMSTWRKETVESSEKHSKL
jgi:hypothetical protein